jgi:membrane associated rhomboid family serine protease
VSSAGTPTPRAPRGGWTLSEEEAQTLVANARRAFFVMVGVLALLWIIQVVNFADHYHLTYSYGIRPRDIPDLPYILTAPFLHFSWTHIEGNSGPLFIFGFLAAYRGIGKFAAVTAVVVLTSGFAAWIFENPHSLGAGASGVVFGYFGYIMVRGIFDRRVIDVLVGAVMALCFAYQFSVLLPHQGIGWQAHIGGLVGGLASGWIFMDRRAGAKARQAANARNSASPSAAIGTSASHPPLTPPPVSAGTSSPSGSSGSALRKQANKPGKSGKGFAVDPSNPRADLYKQLDDLGL